MLEAGRRTQEQLRAKSNGRPKAPVFIGVAKTLRGVLVLFDVSVADLFVTVGLDVGLAFAEAFFCIANRILSLAVGFLHLALDLLAHTFEFLLFVASDFAEFLLRLTGDVFHFAFDLVAVHSRSPFESPAATRELYRCPSTREQLEYQSHNSQHQKQMDEAAQGVAANDSE